MSTISLLPDPCRSCVAWELAGAAAADAHHGGHAAFEKEVWLSGVMLTWGSAGQMVTVDGEAGRLRPVRSAAGGAGHRRVPQRPGVARRGAAGRGPDLGRYRGQGLGRYLFTGVFTELSRRRVRAVELFATADQAGRPALHGDRDGVDPVQAPDSPHGCTVPEAFAKAVGFETIAPHHRFPRMRYELRGGIGWKADVEAALERLFESDPVPGRAGPGAGRSWPADR